MELNIILVYILTFLIHFITTAGLSVRMVGIRTKKMAASYAVYNIVFLVSRFSNTLQAPLLAKNIELSIINMEKPNNQLFVNLITLATLGSILGAIFIPTLQRFMFVAVEKAYSQNSVVSLFNNLIKPKTYKHFIKSFSLPKIQNFKRLKNLKDMPLGIIAMNIIVTSLLTVSVMACLYAGYLNPELRSTSLSFNGFIVGLSTVLFLLVVEPHLGIVADKVIMGEIEESYFRHYLSFVVIARIVGTALSIFLLIPLSYIVVYLSDFVF